MLDSLSIFQRGEWYFFDLDQCIAEDSSCNQYQARPTKKLREQRLLEQALREAKQAASPSLYTPMGDPWNDIMQFGWFVNPWRDANLDALLCTIPDYRTKTNSTWTGHCD